MKIIKKLGLPLISASICTSAFADTRNFEKLSIYLNGSAFNSTYKTEFTTGGNDGRSGNTFAGDIGADYGLRMAENFFVLLGGTYGLNKTKGLDATGSDLSGTYLIEADKRWSIYAAPGMEFSESALLYAKFAYISGKFRIDVPNVFGESTHSGIGIGAGARFLLNDRIFFNVEFMQNHYGKKPYASGNGSAYVSPSATLGTVSLGYSF